MNSWENGRITLSSTRNLSSTILFSLGLSSRGSKSYWDSNMRINPELSAHTWPEFLGVPNAWRYVLQLDRNQQDKFSAMKDAVAALRKHNDLVAGLLQELAPPALPAD